MRATVRTGREVTWLLSCCALDPHLDGVLLLDLPGDELLVVAEAFGAVLGQALHGAPVRRVVVGGTEDEEHLWSGARTSERGGVSCLVPEDGPLVRREHEGALLVVVPDLARAGLAVTRAATMTLGAPEVCLQRHGRARRWAPRTYWVASCTTGDIGRVSPHLLDRFAVRLPADRLGARRDPVSRVLAALAGDARPVLRVPRPEPDWAEVLARAGRPPALDDGAVERALALHPAAPGVRRPEALLRLARGTAWLAGVPAVLAEHVDEAAVLTGLIDATVDTGGQEDPVAPLPDVAPDPTPHERPVSDGDGARPAEETDVAVAEPVLAGAPAEALGPLRTAAAGSRSFPEDDAEPEREAAPLQVPWQRRPGRTGDRGPVIGTAPARDLRDIAWFDSVRRAALFRAVRPRQPDGRLRVTAVDLHAYRRAPQADRLLVLVLDHTCRRGWDWLPVLAPYLHAAYVHRAAVCLVEVGGARAPSPLRAERTLARSLLDPRVQTALQAPPGSATPLAHGLELARTAVVHALRTGAASVDRAELVVITDGLGNVPLEASRRDAVSGTVTDEGITDSLEAARALRDVDRLRAVVVEPPRTRHPQVLLDLVEAISLDRVLVPAEEGEPCPS